MNKGREQGAALLLLPEPTGGCKLPKPTGKELLLRTMAKKEEKRAATRDYSTYFSATLYKHSCGSGGIYKRRRIANSDISAFPRTVPDPASCRQTAEQTEKDRIYPLFIIIFIYIKRLRLPWWHPETTWTATLTCQRCERLWITRHLGWRSRPRKCHWRE